LQNFLEKNIIIKCYGYKKVMIIWRKEALLDGKITIDQVVDQEHEEG
jgi:hypothetical protein